MYWMWTKIVKKGDYLYGVCSVHPKCTRHGYVLLHRLVLENKLGRLLEENEIGHHIDGNKKNNNPDNLEVEIRQEHSRMHTQRMRNGK